ncbi:MFS transporter [Nakamurella leprariae]|uniref:MFS transporter n=1 Tax=Nakamurella leprariae TaxID=2803911 RepID=A0A939C2K6_9ACTN|nr:MFS transporter [Nakamurella leprariae]MBM9468207.1 MFS transporter [Nakamurella leprariae]
MSGPTRPARTWLRPAPAIFVLAWGGNHFTPLLHLYEQVGHYAIWQANLLLGMYVAGLIPGLVVASALSDQHGRRPVLLAGTVLAIAGSVLLASGFSVFWLLCVGRALAGVGVGVAMSVGTSWMKELSSSPFDPGAGPTAGARRPSLTLTLGFGLGAAVTGSLAQWGPAPTVTPYLLHGALTTAALVVLLTAPESLPAQRRTTRSWWRDLAIPSAGHRRFVRLVLPAAPWVFAAAGVAYAIMPSVVQDRLGSWSTMYATVLSVLTLGTGALVQNFVPRLDRLTRGRSLVLGLAMMAAGMVLAVVAALVRDPVLALVVAVALGAAYGVCVVAGLIHVQAIATPQDLAGLTGVYYSVTYTGFLLPTVLAALLPVVPYAGSLTVVSVLCLVSLIVVAHESRQHRIAV